MLEVIKSKRYLQLRYIYSDTPFNQDDWIISKLKRDGYVEIARSIFTLSSRMLANPARMELKIENPFGEIPDVDFNFAELTVVTIDGMSDDYYLVYPNVLVRDTNIYFHKDFNPGIEHFIAETNISIFKQISELVDEDIVIGGQLPNSIPLEEFYLLVENFPTSYEKKLYAQARIASTLRNYFDKVIDAGSKFQKYRNKKPSIRGQSLVKMFSDSEVEKYLTIYERLKTMLDDEESYNETQWQEEIIEILLLLYPKYIAVFREVSITTEGSKRKILDYLFVDANGHIDVVEIKQPFEHAIMTKGTYRDNYIPLRELSGTVMQIEKYIYYLNRWGVRGEKQLTKKYGDLLPENLELHITNPKGFIIMGRENKLSITQKNDFEVVKRKYKNVIDILTYDDLLNRLKLTIEQIKIR